MVPSAISLSFPFMVIFIPNIIHLRKQRDYSGAKFSGQGEDDDGKILINLRNIQLPYGNRPGSPRMKDFGMLLPKL